MHLFVLTIFVLTIFALLGFLNKAYEPKPPKDED